MKLVAVGIFLLSANVAGAQLKYWDTVKYYVQTKKPVFLMELDGRHSFIRDAPVVINGFRVGAGFGNKVRLFMGAYWSHHKVSTTFIEHQYTAYEQLIRQDLSMFYISATGEYVVYTTKHWELAVPVQLGFGAGNRVRYNAVNGEQIQQVRPGFVPFEFSFRATYFITEWFNVSAGLGYRYALFSKTVSADFSAPLYTYGIGVSPIKILKKIGVLEEKSGNLRLKRQ